MRHILKSHDNHMVHRPCLVISLEADEGESERRSSA